MDQFRGQEIPASILGDKRFSTMTQNVKQKLVLPHFTGFQQHGNSGAWVCDFMPHTAGIVDDLCFIKSMHTGAVNHAPAISFFLTGAEQPGRPSMGSWATYGLGTDSDDLPGFVVMTSRDKGSFLRTNLLRLLLELGFSAVEIPGRTFPRQRRSGAVSVESRRHVARSAARFARRPCQAQ